MTLRHIDIRIRLAVTSFVMVMVASALMFSGALRINGIAPNAVLVVLIVVSFFSENTLFYILLALVGALFVRATPTIFDPLAVATTILALLVFFLQRRMVWPGMLGTILTVGATTILLYVGIAPGFLWQHPGLVGLELVYNVVIGLVVFEVFNVFFGRRLRD